MRQQFFECADHSSKNRKKAVKEMYWAVKITPVFGGYMGFESWTDYEIAKNQK